MIQLFLVFFFSKSAVVDSIGLTRIIPLCDSPYDVSSFIRVQRDVSPKSRISLCDGCTLALSLYLYEEVCVPRKTRPPLSDHSKHTHTRDASRRRRYYHHHRHHQRRRRSESLSLSLGVVSRTFWTTCEKRRKKKVIFKP